MFNFPKNLYTDVRIENVYETQITYTMENLDEMKAREYTAAFIRVFDGQKWYYGSTSNIDDIQNEIDALSSMAIPNSKIYENPIIKKLEVNKGDYLTFSKEDISAINKEDKNSLLKDLFPIIKESKFLKIWSARYIDNRKIKNFYSSKGAELSFDSQRTGFSISLNFGSGDKKFSDNFQASSSYFKDLKNKGDGLRTFISKCESFMLNSKPAVPGKYTVVLSPLAAGVFAHESFGHKSEADFMVGDETMKKEWAIGTKVGSDILSIVDSGRVSGSGYVPFDDEGTKAQETCLIKNGVLSGRLHSSSTAASLGEDITGNARSISFEFEPIVRMTTTYIMPGNKTKDELIGEIKDGIYIETIKHGSGMSTFTLAPSLAYTIKNGKIDEPINVSVVTGSVFQALKDIDGLSDKLELLSFVTGGCGKMEQYPLPVGFGGPYVKVNNLNIR